METLKNREQIEELNIIGSAIQGVDSNAKTLIQANINGLITGFRMGLEHKGDNNHGVQTDLHS